MATQNDGYAAMAVGRWTDGRRTDDEWTTNGRRTHDARKKIPAKKNLTKQFRKISDEKIPRKNWPTEYPFVISAAPPGTSVLNSKGKGFLLSLHLKCLHTKYFFPEFCPSKLLNPSLFLSPAPRTFRRPGPRWRETSWFGIFFLKFLLSKHLSNFNFKKTSKKVGK